MNVNAVDKEALLGLKELLGERFVQLVNTYVEDGERRIGLLEQALSAGDLPTVGQESHGLKGSSRNIGANLLADICAQMERESQQQQASDVEPILAALKQAFAAVKAELDDVL